MSTIDIRQLLLSKGMPYEDISIIMDLADHAADEMLRMVERISDTAPDHLKVHVLIVCFMAIDVRLKQANSAITKVTRDMSGS